METIVVSQDAQERDMIAFILRQAGMKVIQKTETNSVIANWTEAPAALLVIVSTNSERTINDLKSFRGLSEVPIIVIAESLSNTRTVDMLKAGADLVLPIPVHPSLLAAYAHALLRRTRAAPLLATPMLDLETIALNPSTRSVRVHGKEAQRLTQLEFQLLYVLMTNRGLAIPTDVLVERVWGYSDKGNRELVRGLVSRLRAKIEHDPSFTTPYAYDAGET
ncbi:MAG: winged helix-turn-helix domain-containing protein [Anaerolineales bacterium]